MSAALVPFTYGTAACPLDIEPQVYSCVHHVMGSGCTFRTYDRWRLQIHLLTSSCRRRFA